MSSWSDWEVAPDAQPKAQDYDYDLEAALASVVALRAIVPPDAFTAETLGTERSGNGVVIADGLVLTMGYLVTEAETIWLTLGDGRTAPGHLLGYDQQTGFALVQPLARLDLPALAIGSSGAAQIGERVVVAGAGGRRRSLAARLVAKQEFAGYWEYVLDEAIFTAPAHPHWGGTAVIGPDGRLLGIGSLQVQAATATGDAASINMVVPIDLLTPILDDLATVGRRRDPLRPWLGVFTTQAEDKLIVVGLAAKGPAETAGLRAGDVILAVAGAEVHDLAGFYRRVWSMGPAGVVVPLTIGRDGRRLDVHVESGDRARFLKAPRLH